MVEFIKVYKDGDCWGAFTRENIAEGECAFADTPQEAAQNLIDELRMWEGKHKKEAIQGKDWDYVNCYEPGYCNEYEVRE